MKKASAKPTISKPRVPHTPEIVHGLRDLFLEELKEMYWSEKALLQSIPFIIEHITIEELSDALTEHLEATKEHVVRLEAIFASMKENAKPQPCEAMAGLIKDTESFIVETTEGVVRDAAIISSVQKIEHYEIAAYGTLRAFAKTLGELEAASVLSDTLEEEKEADDDLSDIAESFINKEAADQKNIHEADCED
ncbi:MAG TPA: ferritin-like domain-containing protein [Cytophagaceae bacterium]|nr:ferritin-like domain-containing protein [Cytophagaceae bacterium]